MFLFQAVVMVIESMHEKTDEAMCKLLQALFRSFVITFDQMKNVSVTISILPYIDVCSGSWLIHGLLTNLIIEHESLDLYCSVKYRAIYTRSLVKYPFICSKLHKFQQGSDWLSCKNTTDYMNPIKNPIFYCLSFGIKCLQRHLL